MTKLRPSLTSLALVASGFAILFGSVLKALVHDWAVDENYSHGFLVIPLAAYLAWERRAIFNAAPGRPAWTGLAVVGGGLLVFAAGVLGSELFLTRVSLLIALTGAVLFLCGWARTRIMAFPLAFLLLMIPLPAIVFNQIAFPLQLLASHVGEVVMTTLHIPVLREGNVLILANTTLDVAEACSGIRSLISLLTLGIVFGYLMDRRSWVRTIIALATVPVAIVANGARVAGTGVAASQFGPEAAEGFVHTFSGWLVFVVSIGMLVALQRALVLWRPAPPAAEKAAAREAA